MDDTKQCTKCKDWHPATLKYFGRAKLGKFGLRAICKVCKAAEAKKYAKTKKGLATNARGHKTYGETINGKLNQTYHHMLGRCNYPNHIAYHRYGGRGIEVLFKSFTEFADYVINVLQIDPRGLTIDRIDNDGHYEPGNIRFVTHKENCQNQGSRSWART